MNKKLLNTGILDVEYILLNYSSMMKWLLNQNYTRARKMAIYDSITKKHLNWLNIATERLRKATGHK